MLEFDFQGRRFVSEDITAPVPHRGYVVLGVPTVRRYDLLGKMLASAEAGTRVPYAYLIIDNGGKFNSATAPRHPGQITSVTVKPGRNVGVAGAWNLMIDAELGDRCMDDPTLVIANDDIVLAADTLERLLAVHRPGQLTMPTDGFVLFALDREVVSKVGWFDENFFPAYCEDFDYLHRAAVAGVPIRQAPISVEHAGSASRMCLEEHKRIRFDKRTDELRAYYRKKWGGWFGDEQYSSPFDGKPPPGWSLRPVTEGGAWQTEPWL